MLFLLALSTLLSVAATQHLVAASNVWTVNCAPLTVQRSDPIVSPNKASGHVHAVVGSTAFSRDMNGINGAASGQATTCDKYTDHSNYWSPTAYHKLSDGTFELLPFTGAVIYYTNYSCDYDASGKCPEPRNAKAFPPGLKMLAGNTMRRTLDLSDPWQAAILFENGNAGEVYGLPKTLDGGRLSGHVRFPSCWDGKNIDSADHQSHVAYPDAKLGGNTQGGMCPESHPHALFNIGAEFGWDLQGIKNPDEIIFSNNDSTGYGFHADFYQGWTDLPALQNSFSTCNSASDCPWFAFGSPDGKAPHPTVRDLETPAPTENIGQNGPISALPGISNMPTGMNMTTTAIANATSAAVAPVSVTSTSASSIVTPTSGTQTKNGAATTTPTPAASGTMAPGAMTVTVTKYGATATVTVSKCASSRTRV